MISIVSLMNGDGDVLEQCLGSIEGLAGIADRCGVCHGLARVGFWVARVVSEQVSRGRSVTGGICFHAVSASGWK